MTRSAIIFSPEGHSLTAWEKTFFKDSDPLGFILFARHVDTPEQLRALTSELRDAVGWDAPILIDQEGGRVQRMRAPNWREYLPPLDQMDRAIDPVRSAWLRARLIADELHSVGIDVNCGPTCDIASDETHPFLMNRCLGRDPKTVTANARATAEGYLAGGVLPVLKHMPGHGRGTVDSHLQLPVADVGLGDAQGWDFAPFKALNDLPMGMSAHIVFPEAGEAPATQNPRLIKIIREDIGFNGLLMTDDISMEALNGTVAERSAVSLKAGCDVVLHCNGNAAEMQSIADVVGPLSDDAARRAAIALAQREPPVPIDIPSCLAELDTLLA